MIIHDGFYLSGFTRLDKGEAGAVFVRYENEAEGGKVRKIGACAVVTRSSKNCYQATVFDARRIAHFKADTLDGLRRTVAQFFKGIAA